MGNRFQEAFVTKCKSVNPNLPFYLEKVFGVQQPGVNLGRSLVSKAYNEDLS